MEVNGPWTDPDHREECPSDQEGTILFRCSSEGFLAHAGPERLGSFDGRDARDLHAYAVGPGDAQLLVSMHEHLHHELQWSTGWGLLAAMAGLLAASGTDPERLRAVESFANRRARHVHEIFATTVSAGVFGVQRGRELMHGNRRYLRYLDQGLSLGGEAAHWPWQFRESATQMLLRNLMQAAELREVAELGFDRVTNESLAGVVAPDARLRRVTDAGGWWGDAFAELVDRDPGRGGELGGPWSRELPPDPTALESLKAYEETVLIPKLGAVARARLGALGLRTLSEDEYFETVEALRTSFSELAPAEWEVEVLARRRPMNHEPLGAERERIQLHPARAVGDVVTADGFGPGHFLLRTGDGQSAVLATYLPGTAYATQFGLDELKEALAVLAVVGWPRMDGHGERHVPLALLTLEPRMLEEAFPSLPLVILTALSVTRHEQFRTQILGLTRAFVLIDLPLNLQIRHWIDDGWTARFAAIDLRSPHGLTLLVFALDELPALYFLSYRSTAGFGELAQLLDRYEGKLTSGLRPAPEVLRDVTIISSWLLSAWWRFQEAENL